MAVEANGKDGAQAFEEGLWQPMVAKRWRQQQALASMGVGARRQFVLLANHVRRPRASSCRAQRSANFAICFRMRARAAAHGVPRLRHLRPRAA